MIQCIISSDERREHKRAAGRKLRQPSEPIRYCVPGILDARSVTPQSLAAYLAQWVK
jgi:hypothetical protein